MPKKRTTKKISIGQAFNAFRMQDRKEADVVLVVRGRLDQEGQWTTSWEAAHWMPELDNSFIAPSGLPSGFGVAAAKEIASITAGDTAEESLGRFGSALGKGIFDAIGQKMNGVMKDKE